MKIATQHIHTFIIKNKEASIKNGIVSFIVANIMLVSTISIIAFMIFYNEAFNKQKIKIIKEQVNLIYINLERSRMSSDFKEIANSIFRLSLVDNVIILNQQCKEIYGLPLNPPIELNCNKSELERDWILLKYNDSFSPLTYILIKIKENKIWGIDKIFIFATLVFSIILTFMIFCSFKFYEKYIKDPLEQIKRVIPSIKNNRLNISDLTKSTPIEIWPLLNSLHNTQTELESIRLELVKSTELKTKIKIANQVAHDIRSPIAAIEMILADIDNLPSNQKNILSFALKRIHKIAQDLLANSKSLESLSPINILSILNPIIGEKRAQFYNKKIKINIKNDDLINETKIVADASDLSRVISNLINNCVEALNNNGVIDVRTYLDNSFVILSIKDNGVGIPSNILPSIMQNGFSHGKENGNGLGLYHAKETIEKLGGSIELFSKEGVGTEVKISIPTI